ncbi:quinolinate synthetase [Desulfosporosinus acidiphilus SJ4]|uniref:Quinolinate synthase n=1 Tax=Desulfosporosinus acidiphilus (strain DSM 22704 / JCM 16185 / SJ4) TaxID=646529 RepID=I4D4Y5_DESAJ|nr:quinolinate synthase NadA [Desulfosporosinus acidiphilus]AFM40859.1 quinolinate synthetase [Desulfosporosinus acidiphilus SJ4]
MYKNQQPIPDEYILMSERDREERIRAIKANLGSKMIILGHHYQRDEVIRFTDYRGDSLKLAQIAAQEKEAEYIVFCGVHFMAETADMLTSPDQKVILPDLNAGCSMAEMADIDDVEECWNRLLAKYSQEIIPVTYVNSSAEVKAFCGCNGGMTCTSSNVTKIFSKLLDEKKSILFLPDEHLGRNTGLTLGLRNQDILLWSRDHSEDVELPQQAPKLILWDGYCGVHQKFKAHHVDEVRKKYPGITVVVHPECSHDVVEKSDLSGSTDFIIRQITAAQKGSIWAVGTEINLVHRLALENPDKKVISLNENTCLCISMSRISQPHLLAALESLNQGNVVNQISVDPKITADAILALNRMLALV